MNVSKSKLLTACVMSLGLVGVSARSEAQTAAMGEAAAPPIRPAHTTEGMFAPDRMSRLEATDDLLRSQRMIADELLSNLKKLSVQPDKNFDAPFHLTVSALGRMRVQTAIEPLEKLIGFQLDSRTAPRGARYGNAAFYPAALALVNIGVGRNWCDKLLRDRLTRPADDATLRASTYVLSQTLGNDLAKVLVQQELTKRVAGLGNPVTDIGKINLDKVLQLLQNENLILENPELKPPATPQTSILLAK